MISRIVDILACRRVLSLNADALAARQAQKLRTTIRHAYRNVPYYRRLFDGAGVNPAAIRTPADLERVPMSSKRDLLDAGLDDLVAGNLERSSLLTAQTSGSTGTAFTVKRTQADVHRRKYDDLCALLKLGFRPWDKLASYTARRSHGGRKPQRWLYRGRWFSALEPLETTAAELAAYNPSMLWAYPSSFTALLEFTHGNLGTVCTPRMLITTSEAPDRVLRDACRELGVEHFNFYGAVETGRIAWECRAHEGLHVDVDNVVLEIVPTAGEDAAGPGETVITTLNYEAMPFIRYRLGDLSRYLDARCSCGMALPLIDAPVGRTSDVVRLPSGRVLTARALGAIIHGQDDVRQFRIVQKSLRHIDIELVAAHASPESLTSELSGQMQQYLGEPIDVTVRVVDSIERTGPKATPFISLVGPD